MAKVAQSPTLKGSVVERLRRDIVCGALRPGTILRDLELARRYDVSTSPVREAVAELTLEGLIDTPPNQAKQVSHIDRKTARDAVIVHRLLAIAAYEIAAPRIDAAGRKAMRSAIALLHRSAKKGDTNGVLVAIRTFNDVVLLATDNRPLRRMIARSFSAIERIVFLWQHQLKGFMAVERLEEIVDALDKGEFDAAVNLFRGMIDQFQRDVEKVAQFF